MSVTMTYVEWRGIVGTYSSGTITRQKALKDPMETTNNYAAQRVQKLPNSNVTAQPLILVGIH